MILVGLVKVFERLLIRSLLQACSLSQPVCSLPRLAGLHLLLKTPAVPRPRQLHPRFNIDVHSVFGLGCYEGANDPMLTTAAMFVGACALLLAGYVFDTKCRHRPIAEAVNKWVKFLMVLLFLAYPGMCLVTARVFECREIEGTWYKTSDVSIHCYEDGWIDDAVVAGTLILVYVIGYPLSTYIVLSRNEHKLWRIPKHDGLGANFPARYGSMYLRYEHKYYLWEILEMLRKLFLTAVIIYILPIKCKLILSHLHICILQTHLS